MRTYRDQRHFTQLAVPTCKMVRVRETKQRDLTQREAPAHRRLSGRPPQPRVWPQRESGPGRRTLAPVDSRGNPRSCTLQTHGRTTQRHRFRQSARHYRPVTEIRRRYYHLLRRREACLSLSGHSKYLNAAVWSREAAPCPHFKLPHGWHVDAWSSVNSPAGHTHALSAMEPYPPQASLRILPSGHATRHRVQFGSPEPKKSGGHGEW